MTLAKIEPKFQTKIVGIETLQDPRIDELIPWCLLFHNRGYAPPYEGGSYGNLSFRVRPDSNEFIITLSKSSLADSKQRDSFAVVRDVDYDKRIVHAIVPRDGAVPSSESMVHHALYRQRPDVNAVFHGHCREVSQYAERLGIPVTKEEKPYSTVALVEQVLAVPEKPIFLEMKNHGFIALGSSIGETGDLVRRVCEEAHFLAK